MEHTTLRLELLDEGGRSLCAGLAIVWGNAYLLAFHADPGAFNLSAADLEAPAAALTHFKKALELDPEFAAAHLNAGIVQLEMKNKEEAIFHLQEAVRLDRKDITAVEKLGEALNLR